MRIALVRIAIVLTVIALGGIITVAALYGSAAAGAMITAWATLVGVLISQVVAVRTATEQREEARRAEDQRAQDEALQAYLDRIMELVHEELNEYHPLSLRRLFARGRTVSLLWQLDPKRKSVLLQTLYESGLIIKGREGEEERNPVIGLSGADLSEVALRERHLPDAALRGADMKGANLERTFLAGADLRGANLSHAYLGRAGGWASIYDATDLRDANLRDANLYRADLSGANLNGAAGITNEKLDQQAASLEGATMPDGQKYEDWLKEKEDSGKDVENE